MRRILSSIDIGTNSIKLVVAEIVRDKVNVLCAVSEESKGIKKGIINLGGNILLIGSKESSSLNNSL